MIFFVVVKLTFLRLSSGVLDGEPYLTKIEREGKVK